MTDYKVTIYEDVLEEISKESSAKDVVVLLSELAANVRRFIGGSGMSQPTKDILLGGITTKILSNGGEVSWDSSVIRPSIYSEVGVLYSNANLAAVWNYGANFSRPGYFYGEKTGYDDSGRISNITDYDMVLSRIPGFAHPGYAFVEASMAVFKAKHSDVEVYKLGGGR